MSLLPLLFFFFFFNDTATTEIYTLSLHDALPILALSDQPCDTKSPIRTRAGKVMGSGKAGIRGGCHVEGAPSDRKSTRLNSSHSQISYAVFCLKKKKNANDICSTLHNVHTVSMSN